MVVADTLTLDPLRPSVLVQATVNKYCTSANRVSIVRVEAVVSAVNSCPAGDLYLTTYLRGPWVELDMHDLKLSVTDRAVRCRLMTDTLGLGGEATCECIKELYKRQGN